MTTNKAPARRISEPTKATTPQYASEAPEDFAFRQKVANALADTLGRPRTPVSPR